MAACCWPGVRPCWARLSMARVRLFLLPGGRPRRPATFSWSPAMHSYAGQYQLAKQTQTPHSEEGQWIEIAVDRRTPPGTVLQVNGAAI